LTVRVLQHDEKRADIDSTYYRSGEGVIGTVYANNETIIVPRIADDTRFAGKLGVYDHELPFIAVPIVIQRQPVGVLAAQPRILNSERVERQAKFLSVVANLVGQIVQLSRTVEQQREEFSDERQRLLEHLNQQYGVENIIGRTDSMRRVYEQIAAVAKWTTTVLVRGESGTGKELVARAIHYNSPRCDKPFVKLNAAALSDHLLESELFGHDKGAFTGAVEDRQGRFERADGGTLFLDEIGEISASFQTKLLRVLQEGEFEPVGGSRTRVVDVRIIAATNRDLEKDVKEGRFREDLYYRLNVMPIFMPPLRTRIDDIPDITAHLLDRIADRQGRELSVTDPAVALLMRYDWPGNVRELENVLERAAIMAGNGVIDRQAVSQTGIEDRILERGGTLVEAPTNFNDPNLDERDRIVAALEHCGWVQAKAARLLGMTARQIAYRIQTLDIKLRKI
jgi:Nif-specific regulatory protein